LGAIIGASWAGCGAAKALPCFLAHSPVPESLRAALGLEESAAGLRKVDIKSVGKGVQ